MKKVKSRFLLIDKFISFILKRKLLLLSCISCVFILFTPLASFAANTPTFLSPIEIKSGLSITQIAQSLISLALLSAFLERAIEIAFKISDKKPVNEKELVNEERRKKCITAFTLVAGICISAIGIRGLEPFFTLSNNPQGNLFRGVDIFLTGTIIAGGTAGIHKILTSLTAFLDVTKASAKAEKATAEEATAVAKKATAEAKKATAEAEKATAETEKELRSITGG